MNFENQLLVSAMTWGADYFGIADLTPAGEVILEQGGTEIAEYPHSISIGITLSKMKEKDVETALCGLCLYACPYGRG